ncbi:MAG: hypothetical protein ABI405_00800 [Parafilimonas sp.]
MRYFLSPKIVLALIFILSSIEVFTQYLQTDLNFLNTSLPISGFIKNCGQVQTMEGGKSKNVFFTFSSSSAVGVYITNTGISYL